MTASSPPPLASSTRKKGAANPSHRTVAKQACKQDNNLLTNHRLACGRASDRKEKPWENVFSGLNTLGASRREKTHNIRFPLERKSEEIGYCLFFFLHPLKEPA